MKLKRSTVIISPTNDIGILRGGQTGCARTRIINRLHKASGRDKSKLVRMAVDVLIERAKVE